MAMKESPNSDAVPAKSNSNTFLSARAGGLRFNSWAVLIGRRGANCSPPLQHFSKGAMLPTGAKTHRRISPTCCTLWRNTSSIMKNLICIHSSYFVSISSFIFYFHFSVSASWLSSSILSLELEV